MSPTQSKVSKASRKPLRVHAGCQPWGITAETEGLKKKHNLFGL